MNCEPAAVRSTSERCRWQTSIGPLPSQLRRRSTTHNSSTGRRLGTATFLGGFNVKVDDVPALALLAMHAATCSAVCQRSTTPQVRVTTGSLFGLVLIPAFRVLQTRRNCHNLQELRGPHPEHSPARLLLGRLDRRSHVISPDCGREDWRHAGRGRHTYHTVVAGLAGYFRGGVVRILPRPEETPPRDGSSATKVASHQRLGFARPSCLLAVGMRATSFQSWGEMFRPKRNDAQHVGA